VPAAQAVDALEVVSAHALPAAQGVQAGAPPSA